MTHQQSLQQKLQNIFPQHFQVKRMVKQIQNLRTLKQKGMFDFKMASVSTNALKFNIQFLATLFKKISNGKANTKVEVCITVGKQYPVTEPKVNFIGNEMEYLKLLPFRNYFSELIPLWNAKITLVDFIDIIPKYICNQSRLAVNLDQMIQKIPFSEKQYFDLDKVFGWKFVQCFPAKLLKNGKLITGFIVISTYEIIVLQISNSSYYIAVEQIPMKQISSILKNKTQPNRILLQIRRKSKNYGIEMISDQYDSLISSIVQYVRQNVQSSKSIQEYGQVSSQQSQQQQKINFFQLKSQNINIQQIKQGICVYQSLVDCQMTSQNVHNLLQLLQKAIQYYSARSDPIFQVYLKKLQELMSNQMTQAIINSKDQQNIKNKNKKQIYKSIVDLF